MSEMVAGLDGHPRGWVAVVLEDAAAVAWSARRIARFEAKPLPDPPEDLAGYPAAIWY